jgi:hypothetical protein
MLGFPVILQYFACRIPPSIMCVEAAISFGFVFHVILVQSPNFLSFVLAAANFFLLLYDLSKRLSTSFVLLRCSTCRLVDWCLVPSTSYSNALHAAYLQLVASSTTCILLKSSLSIGLLQLTPSFCPFDEASPTSFFSFHHFNQSALSSWKLCCTVCYSLLAVWSTSMLLCLATST